MQKLENVLKELKVVLEQHIVKECDGNGSVDKYSLNPWHTWSDIENVIRKHMNVDWIPVEERLPEENGFYIATMDGEIVGQEEPFVGLAEFEDGKWIDDEDDYKCVIAWRPLPEPYQPERRI